MKGCDWVGCCMRNCDQNYLKAWWVPGACGCRDEGEERGGVFRYQQPKRIQDGDGDGGGGGVIGMLSCWRRTIGYSLRYWAMWVLHRDD